MKIYIVISSVNILENIYRLKKELLNSSHDVKILVIDEGDTTIRDANDRLFSGLIYEFYGPDERKLWFKRSFGRNYHKYLHVIPERCHAETSFGFLIAYEEGADVVMELDDDVFPVSNYKLIQSHLDNLFSNKGVKVRSLRGKWYNSLENLELNYSGMIFPRGHPYAQDARLEDYSWVYEGSECVVNVGLWTGYPDLDAVTTLFYGGLNGRSLIKSENIKREKVVVESGTYFAVCSMNTSFVSKIIAAFYQLYMNYKGVDRFDDIWSGIFLKKIADHIGDKVCLGKPLVYHNKRPRNIFKDLKAELEGMAINEVLWRIVHEIELNGKDYYECYLELIGGIARHLNEFNEKFHKDFMNHQLKKMKLWLDIIDKIK